jgi:quercetin dioxygenase-like cupin family protein
MSVPSRGTLVAGFALALVALPSFLCAQELKRTELKRTDLTGTNMEVILGITEIPPGVTLPKHFHHGEEAFYVLEGATVQMPGQAPRTIAAGAGGINIREVPHGGFQVVGDKPLKLLTVHTVDKGKPLYPPAP